MLKCLSSFSLFFFEKKFFFEERVLLLGGYLTKENGLFKKFSSKKGVSLSAAALRAENIELGTHYESRVNELTSAEVTDLLPELNLAHDHRNRTTLSL